MSKVPASTASPSGAGASRHLTASVLSCTLLLVDDSADDRHMVLGYLDSAAPHTHFTVLEAASIEEGLRLLEQVQVHCVLLDHNLPDGTGLDFIERAAAHTPPDRLGIIMLTGQGSEHIAVSAMKCGATDYLAKSEMDGASLCRAIMRAQKLRQLAQEVAESSHARRVAEISLHHKEVNVQRVMDHIEDYAILSLDASGHIMSWNPAARQLFDYHDQDIIGTHLSVLTRDEGDGQPAAAQLLTAAQQGGTQRGGLAFVRRSGSEFRGLSSLSPIVDETDRVVGFAWVVAARQDQQPGARGRP